MLTWRPPQARSSVEAVDRGLVTLALVWQFLWASADSGAWPLEYSGGITTVCMLTSFGLWCLLLVSHLTGRPDAPRLLRGLNVAGLVLASVALTLAVVQTPAHDWAIASSWAVLPAGVAGLLLGWRAALPIIVAVSAMVGVFAFEFLGPGLNDAAPHDVLYAGYALSVGVVTMAARRVLLRDAAAADRAASAAAHATEDRLTAEMLEAAAQREQRVLHETVLNTLTAIVRGGAGTMGETLTRRCWESARVLRAMRGRDAVEPGGGVADRRLEVDVAPELEELRSAGTAVVVECSPLEVPDAAYRALVTATREALVNAHRHADASSVTVSAVTAGDVVHLDAHDDGRGFEVGQAIEGRLGLSGGIIDAVAEVGGSGRIVTAPGAGTTVVLQWQPAGESAVPREPATGAAFAIPALLAFGAYSAAAFLIGFGLAVSSLADAVAFALFVGLAMLVGWASRRGPLPWWVLLVTVGLSPLIYQLSERATVTAGSVDQPEWASGAIGALFVVLIAAGPRHAWLVVIAGWLAIQGDILGELLAAGTAILLAAALFARSSRRNAELLSRSREAAAAQAAAERAAIEQVERIGRRFAALEESTAVELLVDIAEGTRDPESTEVRRWADLEERFIRTVLRIDPRVDDLHALVIDLAVQARRSGVLLDVSVPAGLQSGDYEVDAVRDALAEALAAGEPGGHARLTLTMEGSADGQVLRLVVPVRDEARTAASRLDPPGQELAPGDPDMLWEVRLPVSGAGAVASVPCGSP